MNNDTLRNTCSHQFYDVRHIDQFVYCWPVAPYVDPNGPNDGEPRRHMQYGQTYRCRCGVETTPNRPLRAGHE